MRRPGGKGRPPNRFTTTPTWRSRIKTAPTRTGPRTNKHRMTNTAHVTIVFIPISDVAAHRGSPTARRTAHFFDWVNLGVPPERGPRGSPFPLPARLAVGLGP